jgi:arabinofuranosyltransferase
VLASSKAFVDYSTSGLENPLLHLLLVLFVMACQPGRQGMFAPTLLAALAATTRLDGVLVFAPLLLMRLWEQRTVRGFAAALAGAAPLLAWLAFAVIYYGSAVPNTAYAKLSTGLGWAELVQQGAFYLLHSAREDPLTLVVLLGGLLTPLATPGRQTMALSAGAGLYLIYVLRIGGDFMAGRMLTLPLLACVLTIARAERVGRAALLIALVSVLACAYATPRSPLHSFDGYDMWLGFYDAHGVCDERACYYQHTGLLKARFQRRFPDHPWLAEGAAAAAEPGVVVRENIGMFGYAAGPRVHIVDPWALADPLLARLPRRAGPWRIGHMQRDLPQGYLETLRTGDNCIADPQVAALYERVRLLTRGPLLDTRRLREIARAHLGF